MKNFKPHKYPWTAMSKNVPIWGRGTIVAFLLCQPFTNYANSIESVFPEEINY